MSILRVEHIKRGFRPDKTKVYVDGVKKDFSNLRSGDYALVKIETLNDRIAVEKFIEELKNK